MDYFETVEKRASVRAFKKCTIPDEHITKILEAARRAPTAFTVEPWHFIVVRKQGSLDQLNRVQGCIADAGAAIVAVGDPGKSDFWREDVSAAVENMHMAATALGYGSLWVAVLDKSLVSPVLAIPSRLAPLAIMPIGEPVAPPVQAPRTALRELAHNETFGTPYEE